MWSAVTVWVRGWEQGRWSFRVFLYTPVRAAEHELSEWLSLYKRSREWTTTGNHADGYKEIKLHLVFLQERNNFFVAWWENRILSHLTVWTLPVLKKNPLWCNFRYKAIRRQAPRNPRRWEGRRLESRCPIRRSWTACPVPLSTAPGKTGRLQTHPEWCWASEPWTIYILRSSCRTDASGISFFLFQTRQTSK